MRRSVVTDKRGRILATGPHPEDTYPEEEGAPQYLGYLPLAGQQVHAVEFPRELANMDSLKKIHETHWIKVKKGVATLVQVSASSKGRKAVAGTAKRRAVEKTLK